MFEGIVFCTDLDGTLLRNDGTISRENIEAIEYFKKNGGIFTFVTGRMPFFVSDFCNVIRPNASFGCINGGGLYDYIDQTYLWKCALPQNAVSLIKCIEEQFPGVGIQVNTFYKTYFCRDNATMIEFRRRTGLPNISCDYEVLDEPMAKVIFGTDDETEISKIQDALLSHPLADEFDFIRSEQALYEILPKGSGKGNVIRKFPQYWKGEVRKIIAIGDYDNDVSMLVEADIGIAVANASRKAKEVADYITVSNEEDAIAKVIYSLEEFYLGEEKQDAII